MNYKVLRNTLAGAMVLTGTGAIYEILSVMSTTVEGIKTEERLERKMSGIETKVKEIDPTTDISSLKVECAVLRSDIEFERSELDISKRRTFNGLYLATGLICVVMVCGKGTEYANRRLYSSES